MLPITLQSFLQFKVYSYICMRGIGTEVFLGFIWSLSVAVSNLNVVELESNSTQRWGCWGVGNLEGWARLTYHTTNGLIISAAKNFVAEKSWAPFDSVLQRIVNISYPDNIPNIYRQQYSQRVKAESRNELLVCSEI